MNTDNIIAFPLAAGRRPVAAEEAAPKPRKYKVKGSPKPEGYAPEAGWWPLSRKQKAALAILAKEAARKAYLPEAGPEHDAWRHEQSIAACGLRVSEARQRDWAALRVHFECLCGREAKAFRVALRAEDNGHRIAMHKLRGELAARGLDEGYAETICRSKFKVALRDASAPQVWTVVYDLRGRPKTQGGKQP